MPIAAEGVREASAADRAALAASLAEAFFDDPVSIWCIPPEHLRRPVLTRFFAEYVRQKERYGTVWCDESRAGAAVWAPPGKSKMSIRDTIAMLSKVFHPRLAPRGPMLGIGALQTERKQPKAQDFFYLAALGVDPSAQGRGLGSKLLQPALDICDEDRVGAYLESSKPDNVDFYARHGFRVVGEHRLPRGPVIPLMYRDPA
ncbi:MAG: GNAT family N-acetyltransferase [Solirubrobacterales bacterium]